MLLYRNCFFAHSYQGQLRPQLGAIKQLNRCLKRNEHEPQSTEALNKSKCTTCKSICLHSHRWKYGTPLQNTQTRIIRMWRFFTAFSRVFQGFFTSFSRSFRIFRFCVVFVFFVTISAETMKTWFSEHQRQFQIKPISDRHACSGHPSNRWHPDK